MANHLAWTVQPQDLVVILSTLKKNGLFINPKKLSQKQGYSPIFQPFTKLTTLQINMSPLDLYINQNSQKQQSRKQISTKQNSQKQQLMKMNMNELKDFVKTNKNDANDAHAIVEAASRPLMHFVPIKQVAQQDIQSLHRVRSRLVKNRTALINEIRGLNLEYGITITQGAMNVSKVLRSIIDDEENELTTAMRELMQELYDELVETELRLN